MKQLSVRFYLRANGPSCYYTQIKMIYFEASPLRVPYINLNLPSKLNLHSSSNIPEEHFDV